MGGGYMASTASSAVKKASNQGSNVPCTCAEVMAATQEGDKYVSPTGMELFQITLVGVVRSLSESATRMEYEIDDYTGPCVPVKMFIEDQDGQPGGQQQHSAVNRSFRELSYVRAIGHLRNFQGSKHVIAFRVIEVSRFKIALDRHAKLVPVNDVNEITIHIMEIIYTRAWFTKQKIDENGGGTGAKAIGDTRLNSTTSGSSQVANGLSVLQNQLLSVIRMFVSERGIHVQQICDKLRGIPEKQIRKDLDFLSAEGHIYSTIDDDHFRATEA